MNKYFSYVLFKKIALLGLFFWALTSSFLLLRSKPQTLIIGIDDSGARIIKNENDKLLQKEKQNLVKQFIRSAYNYDSESFNEKITDSGNLMADKLWTQKQEEFKKISENLKTLAIIQTTKIEDIRIIDDLTFEADLLISVENKLKKADTKIKVEIKLAPHKRNNVNPYSWEVTDYVEDLRSAN